jgi:hypothetical protein
MFLLRKQSIHLDVKIQRFPDDKRIITGNKELKRDKERLQDPFWHVFSKPDKDIEV